MHKDGEIRGSTGLDLISLCISYRKPDGIEVKLIMVYLFAHKMQNH